MPNSPEKPPHPSHDRTGYFLVQVSQAEAPAGIAPVVVEDLASGAKYRFDTPRALALFLEGWASGVTGTVEGSRSS